MLYAYAPEGATPVAIAGAFDAADGTKYPPNKVALAEPGELEAIDVYPIIEPTVPAGQRIVSTSLVRLTDPVRVERVAVLEDVPLAERQAARRADVDALYATHSTAGYAHDFGTAGTHVLQTRESDLPFWLALAQTAAIQVGLGNGDAPHGAIRMADNVNVPVTAAEALAAMLGMQAHIGAILAHSWSLKDQIAAAEDGAALDAIDITAGWPA